MNKLNGILVNTSKCNRKKRIRRKKICTGLIGLCCQPETYFHQDKIMQSVREKKKYRSGWPLLPASNKQTKKRFFPRALANFKNKLRLPLWVSTIISSFFSIFLFIFSREKCRKQIFFVSQFKKLCHFIAIISNIFFFFFQRRNILKEKGKWWCFFFFH